MAEPSVKTEQQESLSRAYNTVTMQHAPLPDWKACGGDSNLKQVLIKERAVKDGLAFLTRLLSTFENHELLTPSCQPRMEKINTILRRRREFRVLVGFIGSTGSGKTTLINALLGINNFLPTSSHRASTAVPVELSFNVSNDEAKAFRADIVYITVEEWCKELQQLLDDLSPNQADGNGADDGEDKEREHRINETFDKVKYVYPHIQTREELKSTAVKDLLAHTNVQCVLGTTKKIHNRNRAQFSTKIREYIDSGDIDGASAHWPLLKLVKVYVKSPILRNGIVLVDLPGNMDSNAARTAAAEHYYKELSVTCIVANSTRGISEQNAHELLGNLARRNLQLDGLFNAESLCFILSQTDLHFDSQKYIKDHPSLEALCAADTKRMVQHSNRVAEIKGQTKTFRTSHASNGRLINLLLIQIRDLKLRLGNLSIGSGPTDPKRKLAEEAPEFSRASSQQLDLRDQLIQLEKRLGETRDLAGVEAKTLASFSKRIQHLETALFHARSTLSAACIRHRNNLSIAAIRRDYAQSLHEMGRDVTEPLQVFPVAAGLFLRYKKSDKRQTGFPHPEDTHIPAFRDWLISTTLKTRDSYAQAFLEDLDSFIIHLQPSINDTISDMKMPAELRETWEPQLAESVIALQEGFTELSIQSSNDVKLIVSSGLYSKLSKAEIIAGANSKKTVEVWGKLHWSTHKCVNRNTGVWKDSRLREHKWNEELALELTKPLLVDWHKTLHIDVPAAFAKYVQDAQKLIADFANGAIKREICPEVADAIDVVRDRILKSSRLLQNQSEPTFRDFEKAVKSSHRLASPSIRQFLEPAYTHCANDGGPGHYARNKSRLREIMRDSGVAMHHAASTATRAELDQMLDAIPGKLAVGFDAALGQIKDELKLFFDYNSSSGVRSSSRKVVSISKVKIQKEFQLHFDDLGKKWRNGLTPAEPESAASDDEFEDDHDLYDVEPQGECDSDYEDEN